MQATEKNYNDNITLMKFSNSTTNRTDDESPLNINLYPAQVIDYIYLVIRYLYTYRLNIKYGKVTDYMLKVISYIFLWIDLE